MHAAASLSYWCVVGSFGFGSMRNCPREADLLLVLDGQVQELREVIELPAEVGVVQVGGTLRGRPRRRS